MSTEALRLADALIAIAADELDMAAKYDFEQASATLRQQAAEIERLRVSADQMKRAIVGLLLTDPAGAREDWPEYVAAREALDQWRKA